MDKWEQLWLPGKVVLHFNAEPAAVCVVELELATRERLHHQLLPGTAPWRMISSIHELATRRADKPHKT